VISILPSSVNCRRCSFRSTTISNRVSLEVEGFEAPLRRRRLIQETLKDPPRDPRRALVLTLEHAELNGIALGVPASILWKREEHHCDLLR
jgi:hypothetical protein